MDWKLVCLKWTGQCNISVAPLIYHFLIYYISFANLKNFGILRLHRYSRNTQSKEIMEFDVQSIIDILLLIFLVVECKSEYDDEFKVLKTLQDHTLQKVNLCSTGGSSGSNSDSRCNMHWLERSVEVRFPSVALSAFRGLGLDSLFFLFFCDAIYFL